VTHPLSQRSTIDGVARGCIRLGYRSEKNIELLFGDHSEEVVAAAGENAVGRMCHRVRRRGVVRDSFVKLLTEDEPDGCRSYAERVAVGRR